MKERWWMKVLASWQFALLMVIFLGWNFLSGFHYFKQDTLIEMGRWDVFWASCDLFLCGFWFCTLVYWKNNKDYRDMVDDFLENWSPDIEKMKKSPKHMNWIKR